MLRRQFASLVCPFGARLLSFSPEMKRSADESSAPPAKRAKTSRPTAPSAAALDFLDFVNSSPSPYHATATAKARLLAAGYESLSEKDVWDVKPGGKYVVTRNQSSVIAFAVGEDYEPGNGFNIVAAHTDSPVLRVKPISARKKHGYVQLGVETYGGGLWNTWFDRDLSVAGRVVVADGSGGFVSRLVKIDRPLLRVPNLAIHLNRTIYADGFKYNKETHLAPILATVEKALLGSGDGDGAEESKGDDSELAHPAVLLEVLSEELGCSVDDIQDFELSLFDTQPAACGGARYEFIFSPRLDNLMMSFCSLDSLLRSTESLAGEANVRMIALFDHEEVGSSSMMGAAGTFLEATLRRLSGVEAFSTAITRSLLVSADMAHAVHPNYASKHEERHRPKMHGGLVLKYNTNQRYATTSVSAFALKQLAKRHGLPTQDFVVRQDMGCGSTIGPILSTRLGMRTVDVGIAQLAMHSIREMCGTDDIDSTIRLFQAFFTEFTALDETLKEE
eukprot:PLAT14591.1.p1 GENE.PLAT14591.1~~PLAT14591.1.p1  ORF type:complete len:505 (-),score=210.20 PLAT14591.1:174-1688(-)